MKEGASPLVRERADAQRSMDLEHAAAEIAEDRCRSGSAHQLDATERRTSGQRRDHTPEMAMRDDGTNDEGGPEAAFVNMP